MRAHTGTAEGPFALSAVGRACSGRAEQLEGGVVCECASVPEVPEVPQVGVWGGVALTGRGRTTRF